MMWQWGKRRVEATWNTSHVGVAILEEWLIPYTRSLNGRCPTVAALVTAARV